MGNFELALSKAAEAHRLSLAINNLWGQAYSLAAMGWAYWYTGHPNRAIETAVECIRVGRLAGYLAVQGYDKAGWRICMRSWEPRAWPRTLPARRALGHNHVGRGHGTLAMVQIRLDLRSGGVERAAARLEGIRTAIEHPPHWEEGAAAAGPIGGGAGRGRARPRPAGDDRDTSPACASWACGCRCRKR
jgi:hypothetical protein